MTFLEGNRPTVFVYIVSFVLKLNILKKFLSSCVPGLVPIYLFNVSFPVSMKVEVAEEACGRVSCWIFKLIIGLCLEIKRMLIRYCSLRHVWSYSQERIKMRESFFHCHIVISMEIWLDLFLDQPTVADITNTVEPLLTGRTTNVLLL